MGPIRFSFRSKKDKMTPLNPEPWIRLNPKASHPSMVGDTSINLEDPPLIYRLMEKTHVSYPPSNPPYKVTWDSLLSTPDLEVANAYRDRLVKTQIGYSYDNLEIWPVYIETFGEGNYGSEHS